MAEAALQKRKVEIAEGKHLDIKRNLKVKFEELCELYSKQHAIPSIKKSWYKDLQTIKILKRWFGGKNLHEINPLMINKFKIERVKEVKKSKLEDGKEKFISPATVNRALACLRCMFNKGIEWGLAESNPCKGVKLFKENNQRLRFLEKEEIATLLSHCSEHLKPIVIVALNTGMRKSEILGLKWRDIDIKRNIIHLYETKSGEKRELPMNEAVQKAVIGVFKNPESQYVFCNKDNKPYGHNRKSFATALKNSEIVDFHFHDLRHTFASQLTMSGVDLNTVRELLGHKSLKMTIRYSHLSQDHKKRAVDLLGQRIVSETPENSYKSVTEVKNAEITTKVDLYNSLINKN